MGKQASWGFNRIVILIVGICGAAMMILGVSIYSVTSAELSNQEITVASYNHSSTPNGPHAGEKVRGPFTALAQIGAISHHMDQSARTATGGQSDPTTGEVTGGDSGVTYGTAPSFSLDAQGNCTADLTWTTPDGTGTLTCAKGAAPEVTGGLNAAALAGLRGTLTTGSFLISSLYVSVLAFGVSALIGGLGLIFILLSIVGLRMTKAPASAKETASE